MGGHAKGDYVVRGRDKNLRLIFRDGSDRSMPDVGIMPRQPQTFAYSYIFSDQPKRYASDEPFVELGKAMMADARPSPDSIIPAGYTYLGQFIFHDITFMAQRSIQSRRSPALDLDSVLAVVPSDAESFEFLPIGYTTVIGVPLPEDLPRNTANPEQGKPLIADARNDDLLPLAQCHLLLLKFYNAIARWLGHGRWPDPVDDVAAFRSAVRKIWLQHFQSVVLHDYLPRIVGSKIYADVLRNGRKVVRPDRDDPDWLPLEFAAAIGRYGHSMIRDSYPRWNRHKDGLPVGVTDFIKLSYRNSGNGLAESAHALPGDWISNWFRLFDFSDGPLAHLAEPPMFAARIDTALAPQLKDLPRRIRDDPARERPSSGKFNLASETLRRTFTLSLAPAQEAVAMMNATPGLTPIPLLTELELTQHEGPAVIRVFKEHPELLTKTPLWYYVLKEAEVRAGGNHLGPFGGRIVMETLHAAIEAGDHSILGTEGWRPSLPCTSGRVFTMPDMIAFGGNPDTLGSLGGAFKEGGGNGEA